MTDRLRRALEQGPIVIPYLTFGYPKCETAADLIVAAEDAGAGAIELGVPFSDPTADGPTIQAAMSAALQEGASLTGALQAISDVRNRGCQLPIILFGYFNPIFIMGTQRFVAKAKAAGVNACLVVDLPLEELGEMYAPASQAGLGCIPLVTPTTTVDRLKRLRDFDVPMLYYVSTTGITGQAMANAQQVKERVRLIREHNGTKVAVGFGIRSSQDVAAITRFADAAVVGSELLRRMQAAPGNEVEAAQTAITEWVRAVKDQASS